MKLENEKMKKNVISKILVYLLFAVCSQKSVNAQDGGVLQSGTYSIKIFNSGLALDADVNYDNQDGDRVQLWTYTGSKNQQWRIVLRPDGFYNIFLVSTGKSLDADIAPGPLQDGSKIQIWRFLNGLNQKWEIINVGHGYVIKATGTNLCVEGNGNPNYSGKNKPGAIVDLWDYQGSHTLNEVWILTKLPRLVRID